MENIVKISNISELALWQWEKKVEAILEEQNLQKIQKEKRSQKQTEKSSIILNGLTDQ